MVKKKAPIVKKDSPLPIKPGGKDIIGQKPLIPKVNNNFIYGGLLLAVVGGGLLLRNPALLGQLMGQKPPPGAMVTAPPQVQPGNAVTINGAFNPPVPQGYYVITDQQGNQVANGSLGSNVSTFSQQIPAANLNNGTYTVTVSDSPPMGPAGGPSPGSIVGGAPGSVFPTTGSLQQGLVNNQLGPAVSGPESISLT